MRTLIRGITEYPEDEGVAIYCDQDKGREALGLEIAKWHQAQLKILHKPGARARPDREVSTHYVSSFAYAPLQAADILANDTFRYMKKFLRTGKQEDPYFVSCMRKAGVAVAINFLHDEEIIEMNARAKLHADDP